MTSKHFAANTCISAGIFENLDTFSDLELRISHLPSNKERGDAFEVFAEAYIATQKITLAKEIWPFEAIPLNQRKKLSLDTGRDMGVDGTYLTIDGELRAYQVKFRSNRPSLTWDELSTFMGLTDQVSQRILFTNCETLPSLMQDRSGFIAIRGSDLDRLTKDDLETIHQWLRNRPVKQPQKQPLLHQQEALAKISAGLSENARATVIMACGTGKSLVALWAAEQSKGETVLVLVPSLALVRQLLHEWLRETSWEQLSFLCVCSDPTVTKGIDALTLHQADLDFPVATESEVVKQFLNKSFDGTKIVFSTYQSAHVVAAGLSNGADGFVKSFDLGIFDEAHKTASREGTRFSLALEDANLPIKRRLFFTATPRHYDIRKKTKEGDTTLVYSMDKQEVYGPVVHTLSFAEAARRGIICDYKVVISVVTSSMVNDHLLRHGEVVVEGNAVNARQVALQIALQNAVEKYGVSRIFTFHGSVASAKSFTSEGSEGVTKHLPGFVTLHVSGAMPTSRREDHMRAFRLANKAVMSNARCLTEGVDVPAVDMVAFISPRKSKVDIVQATGRAMRKSPGKEFGYVMVPLFVEQAENESIEAALQRTGFDDLWDLLGAMKEQDDVLADIIRQMQEDKGRIGGYDEARFSDRIEVLGPILSLDTLRGSITAKCLESIGANWDEWYGRLKAFADREGHCRVPSKFKTIDGFHLGQWVSGQRKQISTIYKERKQQLEALPNWSWNIHDELWEMSFNHLLEYAKVEGNSNPPNDYITSSGYGLGRWVSVQRANIRTLTGQQKKLLDSLPGWVWNVIESRWEIGFKNLSLFAEMNGNCLVPKGYKSSNGFSLANWTSTQRQSKNNLTHDRQCRLESLPGWTWDVRDTVWEKHFFLLKEFSDQQGHCRVPKSYKLADQTRLGAWVGTQRHEKDSLPEHRRKLLETLPGWSWDTIADRWNEGFLKLEAFSREMGHCRVNRKYRTSDGFALGTWVGTQRFNREDLNKARKQQLETLPGWLWDAADEQWEIGFKYLQEYSSTLGHSRPPQKYCTIDGFRLGTWVTNQRAGVQSLSHERKIRLEKLPGWTWSAFEQKWAVGYEHLKSYSAREGHCRVPANYRTDDGYRLGVWVRAQLSDNCKLSSARKKLLEMLPSWNDFGLKNKPSYEEL
ncbi:MAG: Helicase associated domain protein [Pseudohongiella sp.]|nr:Helicase associated domain protein [Pseudohongiella sp.]